MKTRHLLIAVALIIVAAASAACDAAAPQPGTLTREEDIVEHGSASTALQQLFGSVAIHAGDVLHVRQGGQAIMDFGDRMRLRLFNDTRTWIESASQDGVPLDVQMFLEEGGFTGELAERGARAAFSTPSGVEITILGTEFFVAYDPASRLTLVGNFHGTVEVASAGVRVAVASGMWVEVASGQAPGRQQPLARTRSEFEQSAHELESILEAARQAAPAPSIQVSPPAGAPGTQISVSGAGWPPGGVVFIGLADPSSGQPPEVDPANVVVSASVDEAGEFVAAFDLPADPRWSGLPLVSIVAQSSWSEAVVPGTFQVIATPTPTHTWTPTATPLPSHTPTPSLTPTPTGIGPGGCAPAGRYLADVTVPDGSVLSAGTAFRKVWRIRNDGTCTWDAGYQLIFSDGNPMGSPAAVRVPFAAPGDTVDLVLDLVAPASAGTHRGRWRLRASNGAIFGGYTVVVNVPATPTPTATPPPQVSFWVDRTQLMAGECTGVHWQTANVAGVWYQGMPAEDSADRRECFRSPGAYALALRVVRQDQTEDIRSVRIVVSPASSGPTIDDFVGTWRNIDADTRGWTRIDISRDGRTLVAHFWGACVPSDCDAGATAAEYTGNPVRMYMDHGFATRNYTLSLDNGALQVTTFTHFTDSSGRKDYTSVDTFTRREPIG